MPKKAASNRKKPSKNKVVDEHEADEKKTSLARKTNKSTPKKSKKKTNKKNKKDKKHTKIKNQKKTQSGQGGLQKIVRKKKKKEVGEAIFQFRGRQVAYEKITFGMFGEKSKLRKYLLILVMGQSYQLTYIALVLAYSGVLAFEKVIESDATFKGINYLLLILNVLFLFDVLAKITVMGFYRHKNAYFKDIFNIFDGFIIIIGFIYSLLFFIGAHELQKNVNFILVLRPMSLMTTNDKAKIYAITLFKAIPALMFALFYFWFALFLYAVVGLYLFSDSQYGRCRLTEKPINGTYWPINGPDWCGTGFLVCPEGTYCGHGYKYGLTLEDDNFQNDGGINFDLTSYNNIGMAIFTTYQAMTFDSWTVHMYGHMRSTNRLVSGIFFISNCAIIHFYLYSLVSAVVITAFAEANEKPSKSKEEMTILIKFAVAKFFQRKLPKSDSFVKDDDIEQQSQEAVSPEKDSFSNQIASNRSTANLMQHNQDRGVQKSKPLKTIESEAEIQQEQLTSNMQNIDQKERGNKTSRKTSSLKFNSKINYKGNASPANLANGKSNRITPKENGFPHIQELQEPIKKSKRSKTEQSKHDPMKARKSMAPSKLSSPLNVNQTPLKSKTIAEKKMEKQMTFNKLVGDFLQKQSMEDRMDEIGRLKNEKEMTIRAEGLGLYKLCLGLIKAKRFNILIQCSIIGNTLLMCFDRYPISIEEYAQIEIANILFSAFFLVEMLIKMIGMSLKQYFKDSFNKLDCLIVLISIFEISFSFVESIDGTVLTPFRVIRMFRIFKLAKGWKSIGQILSTIMKIIVEIGPFAIIMIVYFYISSLIGMNLFYKQVRLDGAGMPNNKEGGFVDSNFNNFFEGFLCVYILVQNDGWSTIFFQHAKATGYLYACYTYFPITLLFGQLIILNLFLTILLENFERDSQENAKNENDDDQEEKIRKHELKINALQEKIESQMDPTDKHNLRMERFQAKFKSKSKAVGISDDLVKQYLFGKSLSCLNLHNHFRKALHKFIYHPMYERFTVFVIVFSNIAMCAESPLLSPDSLAQRVLDVLTYFFAGFFFIEALLKILVLGLVFNGHFSYMRNQQNVTDLIVLLFSLIQIIIGHKARVLKLARVLRISIPLKKVATSEGLKIALESLIMSMLVIGKAITITFIFFLIFAIIFVNLLKGKLYKCTDSLGGFAVYDHVYQCYNYGGFWEPYMWNYDSVPKALINLFNSAITVGYAEMMYWGAKSTKVGGTVEPFDKTNYGYAALSIVFMLTCSVLILSVFVGMIVSAFNREEERISKRSLLSEFQVKWVRLLAEVMKIRPIKSIQSESKVRVMGAQVVQSMIFKKYALVIIVFHSTILALKQYDQEEVFAQTLENLDRLFTIYFCLECGVKLIILRSHYFISSWNKLDLLMNLLGVIYLVNSFIFFEPQPLWARAIKGLRILRSFQLMDQVKLIQILITSAVNSGPALINVGSLMILSYIFYSVLGVYLFGTIRPQWPLDPDIVNYQSVDNVFMILFRATSGENWHYVMYGMSREKTLKYPCDEHFSYEKYAKEGEPNQCGNIYLATFYFVTFHLFIGKAFVSLFIAVILQAYADMMNSIGATINQTHLLNYQRVWFKFDPKGRGFIHKDKLPIFLLELKSPLGFDRKDWEGEQLPFSFMKTLELALYNDLMEFQFYNLLERLARKALIKDLAEKELAEYKIELTEAEKHDQFITMFANHSKEIQNLEENKLKIHIVTEVQKVKNKYQGVGMFEIVTWKEQQSLIKMIRAVKNRYDMLHGNHVSPDKEQEFDKERKLQVSDAENSQLNSKPGQESYEVDVVSQNPGRFVESHVIAGNFINHFAKEQGDQQEVKIKQEQNCEEEQADANSRLSENRVVENFRRRLIGSHAPSQATNMGFDKTQMDHSSRLRLLAGNKNVSMFSHYQEGDGMSENVTEGASRTKLGFSIYQEQDEQIDFKSQGSPEAHEQDLESHFEVGIRKMKGLKKVFDDCQALEEIDENFEADVARIRASRAADQLRINESMLQKMSIKEEVMSYNMKTPDQQRLQMKKQNFMKSKKKGLLKK